LRGGYNYAFEDNKMGDMANSLTGGLGIIINKFLFDYAWIPYGDMGATHRISISTKFGEKKIVKKNHSTLKEI
jgi:hypothetical protein